MVSCVGGVGMDREGRERKRWRVRERRVKGEGGRSGE